MGPNLDPKMDPKWGQIATLNLPIEMLRNGHIPRTETAPKMDPKRVIPQLPSL